MSSELILLVFSELQNMLIKIVYYYWVDSVTCLPSFQKINWIGASVAWKIITIFNRDKECRKCKMMNVTYLWYNDVITLLSKTLQEDLHFPSELNLPMKLYFVLTTSFIFANYFLYWISWIFLFNSECFVEFAT